MPNTFRKSKGRTAGAAKSAGHDAQDTNRSTYTRLEQLPNVGPAIAADFRRLGLHGPQDLVGQDPYLLYEQLGRLTGQQEDPCVLDTFIAVIRFLAGEPAKPWWSYTAERKRQWPSRSAR